MFRGIANLTIDDKGRMAVPTRHRERLMGETNLPVVLTIDTESPCLLLYPLREWELIEQKLAALPSFNAAARRIQRLLIGHATEIELDSHSRVLIPTILRDYAELDKKAMLVGQGNKFEIWSESRWQTERGHWLAAQQASEGLPQELTGLAL